MIEYRVDLQGRTTPVLKSVTVLAFYIAIAVQALCVGTGNAMLLGIFLSFVTTGIVTMSFLLCRPRYWIYLMPVLSFAIVLLMSRDLALALLSMDYFLYGFLIALGLRLHWSKLLSVGAVSLAVLLFAFLQYAASIEAFTFAKGWSELVRGVEGMISQMEAMLVAAGTDSQKTVGDILRETLIPLLPALCITLSNIGAYIMVSGAYRLLQIVPMYRAAISKKHLSFPRILAIAYLTFWIMSFFLPMGNIVSMIILNAVYVLMFPLAVIGVRFLWEKRGQSVGTVRMIYNVGLALLIVAVFFLGIGLAVCLVGFSVVGAVQSSRLKGWRR